MVCANDGNGLGIIPLCRDCSAVVYARCASMSAWVSDQSVNGSDGSTNDVMIVAVRLAVAPSRRVARVCMQRDVFCMMISISVDASR